MKRLLTELYKCPKCSHVISIYKGTKASGYNCPKCSNAKGWELLKGDNDDN